MGLKFKNQNPISDNNTLKVYFCTQTISDDPNDPYADDDIIIVYHIAATTVDEAVDLWIEKYSDITWKDKTREDFTRKSVIEEVCFKTISGLGFESYKLAIDEFL